MLLPRMFCILCIMTLAAGASVPGANRSTSPPAAPPVNPHTISLSPETGSETETAVMAPVQAATSRANYDCWLRVYIIEPDSRWRDYYGIPFQNTLIDFGLDTTLSLAYQETYQTTRSWTSPLGIGDITSDNIKVVAGIFTQEDGGTGQSDTGTSTQNPFTIHTADAAAAATPGHPGYDTAYGTYTHTVLIEEATWEN